MRKNSVLLWIVVVGLLLEFCFACKKKEYNVINHLRFPNTEELTVLKVDSVDDVYMRYPLRVRKKDSCLFVLDLLSMENACHSFAYPTMKHINSFAVKGNGPEEFIRVDEIRLSAEGECWILDPNRSRISCFEYNAPNSLSKVVELDTGLVRTLDFVFYQDSLFIVPDYTGIHRFHILSSTGKIIESHGKIPMKEKNPNIPYIAYGQAWRSYMDYNPDNGILAIVTQMGEVIELYSLPDGKLITLITGFYGEPTFDYIQGNVIPNGIMGYADVFVGKNNIYTIFEGHTFKDIASKKFNKEGGNRIRIFDLEGNPVKEYILDRYISGFIIDEETSSIICLDVNDDQPIIEYKMI